MWQIIFSGKDIIKKVQGLEMIDAGGGMKILKGKTISSGIVKGTVALYTSKDEESIPHYGIDESHAVQTVTRHGR